MDKAIKITIYFKENFLTGIKFKQKIHKIQKILPYNKHSNFPYLCFSSTFYILILFTKIYLI